MDRADELFGFSLRRFRRLIALLESAEYAQRDQDEVLLYLNVLSREENQTQKFQNQVAECAEHLQHVLYVVLAVVVCLVLAFWRWDVSLVLGQFVIGGYAFLVGYYQWMRAERNRNVEDVLARKAVLNNVIKENIKILYPYVGNAFALDTGCVSDMEFIPDPDSSSSRALIDMYVFSELDNLESTFRKARFGLVQPDFAFRAIKIFIARAENKKFARRAGQLVVTGRYNRDFRLLVFDLVRIGLLRREALPCPHPL